MQIFPTSLPERKDTKGTETKPEPHRPRGYSSRIDKARALAIANLEDESKYTAYAVTKKIDSDVYSIAFFRHRRTLQSYAKRHLREPTSQKVGRRQSWTGLAWKNTLSVHTYNWVRNFFDRLLKVSTANKTVNLETHFFWRNNELVCETSPILWQQVPGASPPVLWQPVIAPLTQMSAESSSKYSAKRTFLYRKWLKPLCLCIAIVDMVLISLAHGFLTQNIIIQMQLGTQNFQVEDARNELRKEYQIPGKRDYPCFIYQNKSSPMQSVSTPKNNRFNHSTRSSPSPI